MENLFTPEYFMREALKEAQKAELEDEIPVGAVVVLNNKIIARAHNMTEKLNDCTAHAEMLAITAAENFLGSKYLKDCKLYVTLEPCIMCAGALFWSQISEVHFAASDEKRGYSLFSQSVLHPKTVVNKGVFEFESSELLKNFFQKKRANKLK